MPVESYLTHRKYVFFFFYHPDYVVLEGKGGSPIGVSRINLMAFLANRLLPACQATEM